MFHAVMEGRRQAIIGLQRHGGFDQRSDISTDIDAVLTFVAAGLDVEQASPAHLCALLAHESLGGHQACSHHVGCERSGRTAGCGIFYDSVFWSEHSRIGALASWCEHEYTHRAF